MGSGVSKSSGFDEAAELAKPIDASDCADFDAAKAEVSRLRTLHRKIHRSQRSARAFALCDTDASGKLDCKELNEMMAEYQAKLKALGEEVTLGDDADIKFWYDANDDGKLSSAEFEQWFTELVAGYTVEGFGKASDLLMQTAKQRRIAALFGAWDANGSGFLEVKELNAVLKSYQDSLSQADRVLDADADADAGVLFWYDGDGDGKLSKEEFVVWFGELVAGFADAKFVEALAGLTKAIGAAAPAGAASSAPAGTASSAPAGAASSS